MTSLRKVNLFEAPTEPDETDPDGYRVELFAFDAS